MFATCTIGKAATAALLTDDRPDDDWYFLFKALGQHAHLSMIPLTTLADFGGGTFDPDLEPMKFFSPSRELLTVATREMIETFRADPVLPTQSFDLAVGHAASERAAQLIAKSLALPPLRLFPDPSRVRQHGLGRPFPSRSAWPSARTGCGAETRSCSASVRRASRSPLPPSRIDGCLEGTAVDADALTGEVAGALGDQEADGVGDLFGGRLPYLAPARHGSHVQPARPQWCPFWCPLGAGHCGQSRDKAVRGDRWLSGRAHPKRPSFRTAARSRHRPDRIALDWGGGDHGIG